MKILTCPKLRLRAVNIRENSLTHFYIVIKCVRKPAHTFSKYIFPVYEYFLTDILSMCVCVCVPNGIWDKIFVYYHTISHNKMHP